MTGGATRDAWIDRCVLVVAAIYLSLLGGARLAEMLSLPDDMMPGPEYPYWLIEYLTVIAAALLASGVALALAAFAAWKYRAAARPLGTIGALAWLATTGAHGWFLYARERAFGDGGLVFGVLHVLTLTRIDTRASAAGIAGYRVGQALGVLAWAGGALLLLAASQRLRDDEDARLSSPGVRAPG